LEIGKWKRIVNYEMISDHSQTDLSGLPPDFYRNAFGRIPSESLTKIFPDPQISAAGKTFDP
jgi:hypothetical protein